MMINSLKLKTKSRIFQLKNNPLNTTNSKAFTN
jgi:hypothetical protein